MRAMMLRSGGTSAVGMAYVAAAMYHQVYVAWREGITGPWAARGVGTTVMGRCTGRSRFAYPS